MQLTTTKKHLAAHQKKIAAQNKAVEQSALVALSVQVKAVLVVVLAANKKIKFGVPQAIEALFLSLINYQKNEIILHHFSRCPIVYNVQKRNHY
jgi:hypothetical protein